jgi:hypothetical protein
MTRFQVADRVLAVVPNGASEVTIVEGFVTGIEQDGRLVAVRPASPDEWEEGIMDNDPAALSWWWGASEVYHVVDADKAIEQCSRMNADDDVLQGGCEDELGVDC